jgi:hypothetical protein
VYSVKTIGGSEKSAREGNLQFTTYFDAQNEAELNQALDSIGQTVDISCRYQLGAVSQEADRDSTDIHFDGRELLLDNIL